MRKSLHVSLSAAALLLAVLAAAPAGAQETTGAIEGIVTGSNGEALPGVTFEVSGDRLAVDAVTVSNNSGRYRFPALPPGDYEMTASLDGMATTRVPRSVSASATS